MGTSTEAIHLARKRGLWPSPGGGPCGSQAWSGPLGCRAKSIADEIGYPVLVRPPSVLGGRGWRSSRDDAVGYIGRATRIASHPAVDTSR